MAATAPVVGRLRNKPGFDRAHVVTLTGRCSAGGQNAHVQPFSDEDASIETLSHCSSFSDSTSVADEGEFGPRLRALPIPLPALLHVWRLIP